MTSVTYSPDGLRIAASVWLSKGQTSLAYLAKFGEGVATEVRQWNASTGKPLETFVGKAPEGIGTKGMSELLCAAYSPDGKLVAGGAKLVGIWPIHGLHLGGEVCVWDTATGRTKWSNHSTHTDVVQAIVFSPDSKIVASGGMDKLVRLWNAETGDPIKTLYGVGYDGINGLAFSPDGKLIASSGFGREEGGRIRVWNVETGELKHTLGRLARAVRTTFLANDVLLAAIAVDGPPNPAEPLWQLQEFKLPDRKPMRVFPRRTGTPSSMALSANGATLAVGTYEGEVTLYRTAE